MGFMTIIIIFILKVCVLEGGVLKSMCASRDFSVNSFKVELKHCLFVYLFIYTFAILP